MPVLHQCYLVFLHGKRSWVGPADRCSTLTRAVPSAFNIAEHSTVSLGNHFDFAPRRGRRLAIEPYDNFAYKLAQRDQGKAGV